jgi:hypothetical protein
LRQCALALGALAGLLGSPVIVTAAPARPAAPALRTPAAAGAHRRIVQPIGARQVAPLGAAHHAGRTIAVRRSLPR